MTSPLPRVNTLVRLVLAATEEDQSSEGGLLGEGVELSSRIEANDGHTMAVAAPSVAPERIPVPGETLLVRWTTPRGFSEVPAVLVGIEYDRPPLWRVEVCGEVVTMQRRRFVRADAGARVIVAVPSDPESRRPQPSARGNLLDLSEGGARCRVNRPSELGEGSLEPGRELELRLGLDDTILRVVGTIVRSRTEVSDTEPEHAEVVLEFESEEPVAGLIRRFVFQHQALARRTAGALTSERRNG